MIGNMGPSGTAAAVAALLGGSSLLRPALRGGTPPWATRIQKAQNQIFLKA